MDYGSEAVKAAYLTARERLSGVDKLVEVALFAASRSNNQQACSQTARLGFEALTGGLDMTKAPDNEIRFFVQDKDVQPQLTDKPTVTYVSLTNDASKRFADDSGHRFLVLQSHGQFRVVQANNGECTAAEFDAGITYATAPARAKMNHTQFQAWWEKLVAALKAGQLTKPVYDANNLSGSNMKQNDLGRQLPAVLGVNYDRISNDSWFIQHEVVF